MSLAQLYEVTVGPLVLKYFITKWWQILLRILERILHFNYLLMKSLHFITFVVYWTKKLPRQVMREATSAHECRNVFDVLPHICLIKYKQVGERHAADPTSPSGMLTNKMQRDASILISTWLPNHIINCIPTWVAILEYFYSIFYKILIYF